MRSARGIVVVILVLLSSFAISRAQGAFTSLRGTVTDPTGAVVPSATIAIHDQSTGLSTTQTANATGGFLFAQIPPGTYSIVAAAGGFGSQTKVAALLVNQPATVNFALTVQTVSSTVDVSAEAQT